MQSAFSPLFAAAVRVQDEEQRQQIMARKQAPQEKLNVLSDTLKKKEEDVDMKKQEEKLKALRESLKKKDEEYWNLRAQREEEMSRI